jgi:hypothetical protein
MVDIALERDEADNFNPKRLREMRRGATAIMIVIAGSWAIILWAVIFYVARIVFQ